MNDDLNFVEEAVRKERTDRTVDQAARQRFLFGRTTFTLEEAAGDLAGGVGLFNVVDREREEVLTGLRFLLGDDRGEDDRIVHAADAGAGRLAGDLTGFERDVVVAEAEGLRDLVEHRHRGCFLKNSSFSSAGLNRASVTAPDNSRRLLERCGANGLP